MNTFAPLPPAKAAAFQRPFTPNYPQAPPAGRLPQPMLQPPASRPSYDLAGLGSYLGPWYHVPLAQDYNLYRKLREAIPVLDAAVLWLRKLVGVPEVESESERLKKDVNRWLDDLEVNRIQVGWTNWLETWLDDMLAYGRAHAEVVLSNSRTEVVALLELHPATCALRPRPDGFSLDVVQYQSMGGVPVLMNPDLMLTAVNDIRADDPNGTSLFFSLPFVGEIWNGMTRSLGQTWGRFGSPTYHVNWEPPADWNDPTGQQSQAIMAPIMTNFQTAMQDRASGQLRDVFTTGTVKVEVVGAAGEELQYEAPARELMQQIVAKTGLPPFLFGFQWSTTERMSTVQATLLSENIDSIRAQVLPKLYRLIELRNAISGRSGAFRLAWPETSLMDRMEEARADWMEAQSQQIELANWSKRVLLGINNMPDMARHFRPELAEFDDKEIKAELPELVDAPPEPSPPPPDAGGGPPQGPNGPSGEGMRALPPSAAWAVRVGANGRH